MNAKTQARCKARAKIFKALAHPTRVFIVDQLRHAPQRCVCELTAMIGADMSTVSKHLAILKEAGIVQDEKRGSQVFYRLHMKCVLSFFDCVESAIQCRVREQRKLVT